MDIKTIKECTSLCKKDASVVVSRDKGEPQEHRAINVDRQTVAQYRVDGDIITQGERCDFLVLNEDKKNAYLIELKGHHLTKAAAQLDTTAKVLQKQLSSYRVHCRIVASRSCTHDIRDSAFRKFQARWGKTFGMKSGLYQENI